MLRDGLGDEAVESNSGRGVDWCVTRPRRSAATSKCVEPSCRNCSQAISTKSTGAESPPNCGLLLIESAHLQRPSTLACDPRPLQTAHLDRDRSRRGGLNLVRFPEDEIEAAREEVSPRRGRICWNLLEATPGRPEQTGRRVRARAIFQRKIHEDHRKTGHGQFSTHGFESRTPRHFPPEISAISRGPSWRLQNVSKSAPTSPIH